jgi:hypothetical protein
MRVDDRNITGHQALQTGKAAGAQELDRLNASKQAESRLTGTADRVEISALTGGLARTLEAYEKSRASRVESLAQSYAAGQYQAEPRAVSRAIIAETLAAGSGRGQD